MQLAGLLCLLVALFGVCTVPAVALAYQSLKIFIGGSIGFTLLLLAAIALIYFGHKPEERLPEGN